MNRKRLNPLPQDSHLPPRIHSIPVTAEYSLEPDDPLSEIENEIGQNEWIDPETGELAEGPSPPHLADD